MINQKYVGNALGESFTLVLKRVSTRGAYAVVEGPSAAKHMELKNRSERNNLSFPIATWSWPHDRVERISVVSWLEQFRSHS